MDYAADALYASYATPRLALSLALDRPRIAFLGVNAGARCDRHHHHNLLVPGPAAEWRVGGLAPSGVPFHGADGVRYACGFEVKCDGDDAFVVRLPDPAAEAGGAGPGADAAFSWHFSNTVAPVTVWSPGFDRPVRAPSADDRFAAPWAAAEYRFPLVLHFPDHGRMLVELVDGEVDVREELVAHPDRFGLSLGFRNHGYHTAMHALHHGWAKLSFLPRGAATLRFRALPEQAPEAVLPDGRAADFSAPRWNGLRRCWPNSFTLERRTHTMGDNIALHGVAHLAMHMKADLLLATPAMENGTHVRAWLERGLDASFTQSQADDGEVSFHYFHRKKERGRRMADFADSTPSVLIAYAEAASWNPAFAERHYPAALRAATFLAGLDENGDGAVELPFHGRFFDDSVIRPRNWWDNFACGHQDAYFNCLAHRALRQFSDLAERTGRAKDAAPFRALREKFLAAADAIFLNPDSGLYAGWRDVDGRLHDAPYTFATTMAINEGVIPAARGRAMMEKLLAVLDDSGFGDFRYGVPGPARPVPASDTIKWDVLGAWPWYENGGLCGMNAMHFLTALYNVGLRDRADAILFKMLETFDALPTHSGIMPGYRESVDWRSKDGFASGYNYLADNYYFLLAGVVGHYAVPHPVSHPR